VLRGEAGRERLVAYVAGARAQADLEAVRAGLAGELPEYMVPQAVVLVDALPLTRSGKVDYAALPEPEEIGARGARDYVAPQGELEQVIADVWQRLLRVGKVCVHENFFDAGGHSLLMVQFYHGLREVVGGEFTLLDLFQHPTVSLLAKHLGGAQAERKRPESIRERVNKREEALMRHRQLMAERKVVNG
nr:phosphopantetheine-binding protein [Acidobacteriota bacterium]